MTAGYYPRRQWFSLRLATTVEKALDPELCLFFGTLLFLAVTSGWRMVVWRQAYVDAGSMPNKALFSGQSADVAGHTV